ncbi:transcriptional regulator, LysR family [Moritella sp. PE36]|uniref:LysR family transcriptional regulator n=1 Tax=Moritella sp. PE36 TaxID=58051 RepID=UPI0001568554|nr:LysR family transcriptional regulator [Moritella sp. PE36]EDM67128.1 transcriptional regulator, LysR family [Moritella sp. PE36]
MDTLDGIKTVIAVVETGSFTAASERLAMSKALVSKYVAEVEAQLGVRLFNRSTRRLALTEAGQRYYDSALPLLGEFSELVDNVTGEQTSPRGNLRISTSVTFGDTMLSPKLAAFLARFPDIKVDLQLTDRMIDMLEEAVDVVIRIGSVDDSSLIARKIADFPLTLCASPQYLATHGHPRKPQDINQHNCIIDSNFRIGKQWPVIDSNGKTEIISVKSNVAVNSPRAVKAMAISGGGIALIPHFIIKDALESGILEEVLPGYSTLTFGMFAIYPHRRYLPKTSRCFIDFLIAEFGT